MVHQRGTGHSRLAIDEHGARTANFLQAIRVVGDWGRRFAVTGHGIARNLHHGGNHVHSPMPGELKLLPARLGVGRILAANFEEDGFLRHGLASEIHRNKNHREGHEFTRADLV